MITIFYFFNKEKRIDVPLELSVIYYNINKKYCIDNILVIQHNLHMKMLMKKIFTDLNQAVEFENRQRLKEGALTIPKSEVLLFGQMSLMLNESEDNFE